MILLLDSMNNKNYRNDIAFLKEYYDEKDVVRVCLEYETEETMAKIMDKSHDYIFIYVTEECEKCNNFQPYLRNLILIGAKLKYKKNILKEIDAKNEDLMCIYKHYVNEPGIKARLDYVTRKLQYIIKKYRYQMGGE